MIEYFFARGGRLLLEGLKWCIEEAWNRYTLSVCVIISVSRVYHIESIGIIRTDIEPCKYKELRRIEKYRGRRVRNDRKIGERRGGRGELTLIRNDGIITYGSITDLSPAAFFSRCPTFVTREKSWCVWQILSHVVKYRYVINISWINFTTCYLSLSCVRDTVR